MKRLQSIISGLAILALLAGVLGCTTTQQGAGIGAVVGAGAGAIIGHNTGAGPGAGALVGAAVGGLGGALAGDAIDEHNEKQRHNPPRNQTYYAPPVQQSPHGPNY